jgi:hypothetical protein
VLFNRSSVLDTEDSGRTVHAESIISDVVPRSERVRSPLEELIDGGEDRLLGDHGAYVVATAGGGSPFGADLVAQHGSTVSLTSSTNIKRPIRRMLQAEPDLPLRMDTAVIWVAVLIAPLHRG